MQYKVSKDMSRVRRIVKPYVSMMRIHKVASFEVTRYVLQDVSDTISELERDVGANVFFTIIDSNE
jgi:hypothetical protein